VRADNNLQVKMYFAHVERGGSDAELYSIDLFSLNIISRLYLLSHLYCLVSVVLLAIGQTLLYLIIQV